MGHVTPAQGSQFFVQLVVELCDERNAVRLVERARVVLARELGASWSAVFGRGAAPLGDVRHFENVPKHVVNRDTPELHSNAAVHVELFDGEVALHVRRVDATQVTLLFGCGVPHEAVEIRSLVHAIGVFIRARLDDLFEVESVRHEHALLDRRVAEMSLLFKGLDVALSTVELPKVMRAFMTCVTAGDAIGFNRAFLFLLDEGTQELHGTLAVGPSSGVEAQRVWTRLRDDEASLEETLRRGQEETKKPLRHGSLADRIRSIRIPLDASYSVLASTALRSDSTPVRFCHSEDGEPFVEMFGSGDFVVVPILGRERTIGVLVADNFYTGESIDDEKIELLSGLAGHVGVIIENVLVFDDVSRRYAELSEVQAINRALLSSTEFDDVLGHIAQTSASMLHADGSLLFVSDATSQELRLEMQFHSGGTRLSDDNLRRCTEIASETLRGSAGVGQRHTSEGEGAATLDLLSASMQIDGDVAGVLVAYRRAGSEGPRAFDEHSRRFLSIIADQAAIAVLSGRHMQTIRDDQLRINSLSGLLYRNEKLAALGEAASMIAHEIRNPLTALGGFARRMLRQSNLASGDRHAVGVIVDETARLERILNDQLAFVRSACLERSLTSLNDLIRESRTLLRQQIADADVELELDLDANAPSLALDGDRMKQVIVNLLMNAIDAAPRGRIRVSTLLRAATLELDVANTGPPVAPEQRATLFEPFATARQDGTGLGLAVVYQIVTEHDGRIEVLSEHEWGTIFRIHLDVAAPQTVAGEDPAPSAT